MGNKIFFIVFLINLLFEERAMEFGKLPISDHFQKMKETLVHILKLCDAEYDIIIFHDAGDGSIVESLSNLEPLSSIILYKDATITKKHIDNTKKIDAVIIGKESLGQLITMVDAFNTTPWWNVMTPHFILETATNHTDDIFATFEFLLQKDILIAYFIAVDEHGLVNIITMNPFAKWAPSSWNFLATMKNQSALYTRPFDKDDTCKDFYFDRTQYLNGHKIKMAFFDDLGESYYSFPKYIYTERDIKYVLPYHNQFQIQALIIILNLTMEIYLETSPPHYDLIRSDKYVYDRTDINLVLNLTFDSRNQFFAGSFPIKFDYLNLLVHHRGFKTSFEKIRDYYGIWTLSSIILILFITFVVIKCINNDKGFAFVAFEILRFIINTSIYTKMNSSSHKIFFSVIFLYFLVMHSTLSGHLVEFLTKSELRENIETLEDLKDSEYRFIYYSSPTAQYIEGLEIKDKKLKKDDDTTCLSRTITDELTVCADFESSILMLLSMMKSRKITAMCVPGKAFGFNYQTFFIRRQWSLNSRINKVFSYLFETDLNDISRKKYYKSIQEGEKRVLAQEEVNFIPIKLDVLTFAFIILGIGLTCAAISFVIEIKYEKMKSALLQKGTKNI